MTDPSLTRRAVLATTLTGTASALVPTGGAAGEASDTGPVQTPHEEYVVAVQPGVAGVWVRLDIDPNGADRLVYDPPEYVTVRATRGFDDVADGLLWTGTAHPQVVYTVSPRFSWAVDDRWGFLSTAEVTLPTDGAETTHAVTLATGGYEHPDRTGQSYVGPSETETRSVAGTATTYVRPEPWQAPSAPDPETFFTIVETTAAALSLSDPYQTIGYAAPALDGANGYAKRATTADTATTQFSFLDDSLSTIAHEYVHTQQSYFEARDYAWLLEGVATFYEHLVGYRHGLGSLSPLDGASTAEPLLGGRRTSVVYDKGAAMCFLLDQRLRAVSDGSKTLGDVFQALNDYDGEQETVSHEQFKEIVAEASGVRLDGWLDERIADPFEITLPADLSQQYPGPERSRPVIDDSPTTVTPGSSDNDLLVGFAVGDHQQSLDSIELQIAVDDPGTVTIGTPVPTGDAHESVTTAGDGSERRLELSFSEASEPPSLAALAPIRVSLDPAGVGATRITVTGSVTDVDGQTTSFDPAVSGTRALIDTPPPAEPRVGPKTVPVGEPVDLFVLDPDPSLRYTWRFDGSDVPQAVGPQTTRRFSLLGDQPVEVTAVDRTGDRATSAATITVAEDAPGLGAYVDDECLLRRHRYGGLSGLSSTGDSGVPIEVVRQCYSEPR